MMSGDSLREKMPANILTLRAYKVLRARWGRRARA